VGATSAWWRLNEMAQRDPEVIRRVLAGESADHPLDQKSLERVTSARPESTSAYTGEKRGDRPPR
jgi:hypothetical protein